MSPPVTIASPSLVSVWSSAPFLHNNTLGKFTGDPSVAGRTGRLQRRGRKIALAGKTARTRIRSGEPKTNAHCICARNLCRNRFERLADKDGYINIGPIPKGAPINLIANLEPDLGQLVVLQAKIAQGVAENSHA